MSLRLVLRALLLFAVLAGGFAAITLWALESREVVVLRTFDASGKARETRVWIAEDEAGVPWLEAPYPERPWLLDVNAHPEVEVVRGGVARRWRAVPVPGSESHARIRRLLRDKYGLRDVWVGVVADTSRSLGVRLEAVGPVP